MTLFRDSFVLLFMLGFFASSASALDCEPNWPIDVKQKVANQSPPNLLQSADVELTGTGGTTRIGPYVGSDGIGVTVTQSTPPPSQGNACLSIPNSVKVEALYCGVANEDGKPLSACYSVGSHKECPLGYIYNTAVHVTPTNTGQTVCVTFENHSGDLVRHVGIVVRTSPARSSLLIESPDTIVGGLKANMGNENPQPVAISRIHTRTM